MESDLFFLIAHFTNIVVRVVWVSPMISPLFLMVPLRGHWFSSLREPTMPGDADGESRLDEAVVAWTIDLPTLPS